MRFPWFWSLAALASVSLGVAAAPVTWHLLGEVETGAPALSVQAATALSVDVASSVGITPILAFAPFGSAAPPPVPVQTEVPATQLGLTLLGLTIATPASASRAIIAGGDLPVSSYAVGGAITATVTLAEVQPDHVILMVNGAPEALFFARGANDFTLQPTIMVPIANTGPPDPTNPDAVIAYYRDQILQNPQSVMDRLGLQATPNGYLIADAADADVRRAGFQPGDLVTRVNGQAVGDVARDQVYFDEIAASGRATVEVQRAGQIITMTFPLR
jgi:general secretion pathway protein C